MFSNAKDTLIHYLRLNIKHFNLDNRAEIEGIFEEIEEEFNKLEKRIIALENKKE